MIAKKISDNSWIFSSDLGNMVSIVTKKSDNQFLSTHRPETIFASLDVIAADFSEKLVEKHDK